MAPKEIAVFVKFMVTLSIIGSVVVVLLGTNDARGREYKSRCLATHNAWESAQAMQHMVALEMAMPESPFKEKSIAEAKAKADKAWKDFERWRDQLGEPGAFCEPCAIW